MNLDQLSYLVVDDMELMRAVTVNQLRGMGFEKVKVARHGLEALEMLRASHFDVVLSDWNMPHMSGLELLKALRADAKLANIPFLMVTAEAERQRIEEVISAGVNGLLVKPYNASSLKARLERVLDPSRRGRPPAPATTKAAPDAWLGDGGGPLKVLSASRILVVDDHPVSRKLLETMFADDYQVSTASDGALALAQCQTDPLPDLILMDVLMPGLDGFEVVRSLRAQPRSANVPVIFVTGLNDDEARLKGMELGAVDFVSKNADPKALRARVRNFIQFVDLRRKLQLDYDAMLDAARMREDADNMTRHDLKGSLAGILGMLQSLAEDDSMAPQHAAQLRLVQQTAEQVINMVSLSGELYKIEMGRFKLKPVAVDIGEILHRLVDLSRAGFADKQLTIAVDTDSPVGTELPQVQGDALLCYSLFQNLLKNACEAAPPGSRVEVLLRDESPLRILINNLGAVPSDMRERFFDKFATSGKTGGSGIGTYSAQLLVRAQHGSISMATDEANNCTTLTVSLPRHGFETAAPKP
jgi:CheY-like chemotaxis protein